MVSISEGLILIVAGCGFVLLIELAETLYYLLAIPLIVLALVSFHAALFSVVAPHRLGIQKDEAYWRQPRRTRIGVPLLITTAGIGMGFGINAIIN